MECLDSFERFLHDEKYVLPVLVEAGLVHVQFETIHPFLDGNGRLGRLLITLLRCSREAYVSRFCTSASTSKQTVTVITIGFSVCEHRAHGKSGWRSFSKERRLRPALPLKLQNRF